MWNLFKKKPTRIAFEDQIWIHQEAKIKGLLNFFKHSESSRHLLLSFFPKTLEDFQESTSTADIELGRRVDIEEGCSILALSLNEFHEAKPSVNAWLSSEPNSQIIFLEHYPGLELEQALLRELKEAHPNILAIFFMALDDVFFSKFGGERIQKMMQNMGIKEDEMISHTLISRSIQNAQKKYQAQVKSEIFTSSMEEWFQKNLD